jgi:hypothetical protein
MVLTLLGYLQDDVEGALFYPVYAPRKSCLTTLIARDLYSKMRAM